MSEKGKHIVVKSEIHKKLKQKALDDETTIEKTTNNILEKELKE